MKHLRQCKRLSLLLLALAMGSLHVQTVYACSALGERLQSTCCCDESASEACGDIKSFHSGLSRSAQACCEVGLSPAFDDEVVFTPSAQQAKSGATPLAPPPSISAAIAAGAGVPADKAGPPPDRQPAPAIYLTTRRIRI